MNDSKFWAIWFATVFLSFASYELYALIKKQRGDREARTFTDIVKKFMAIHWSTKLLVVFLLVWMFLHFLEIGGL